jgi:hypothetical protein
MKKAKFLAVYTIVVVIFTCLLTLLVTTLWNNRGSDEPDTVEITNDVVIDRITEQAFLVTRTVYSDQQVEIEVDQGSSWSNFWWGKTIVASGRVRTDVGVDFSELNESDIEIDEENKVIRIEGLESEILDSSIEGNLEVDDQGSIIRRILTDRSDEDYETASQQLIDSARRLLEGDEELSNDVIEATEEFLSALFDNDYTVEIETEANMEE